MPTRDQMDSVQRRIETLEGERFRPVDGEMKPAGPDAPGDSLTWQQLNFEQSLEALHYEVDWSGFTVELQVEVSLRVVDGQPSSEWMGDIEASDRREHAEAFHRERQEDRWVSEHGRLPTPEELRQDAEETRAAWDTVRVPEEPIAPHPPMSDAKIDEPVAGVDGAKSREGENTIDLSREAKLRDFFDDSIRHRAELYVADHVDRPAMSNLVQERVIEAYIKAAETDWEWWKQEAASMTTSAIVDQHDYFKEWLREVKDVIPENNRSKHDDELEIGFEDYEFEDISPLTKELINCCELDVWPGIAAVVDFGIDSTSHFGAIQFAVREQLVTFWELDAAMGKGEALTEIAQRGKNPYRDVTFKTAWDKMSTDPEDHSSPGVSGPPAAVPAKTDYDRRLQEAAEYGMSLPRDTDRGRDR